MASFLGTGMDAFILIFITILVLLLIPFWLPCMGIRYLITGKWFEGRLCGYQSPSPPPAAEPVRPLPQIRQRALSILQPASQDNCQLLDKLPAELRLLIWSHVLGREHEEDVLHIELGDGIVRYARCHGNKSPYPHSCWRAPWTMTERRLQNADGTSARPLLALLLTCRLIYRESVELLYSTNTFDFRRIDTILRLPAVILPHRLQCIRSIRFTTTFNLIETEMMQPRHDVIAESKAWRQPDYAGFWPVACDIFASMKQLHDLDITLEEWLYRGFSRSEDSLYFLLQPLANINIENFTVTLSEMPSDKLLGLLDDVPYTIKIESLKLA